MKSTLLGFIFMFAVGVSAWAQEEFRSLNGMPLPGAVVLQDKPAMMDQMTIGIRLPFLGGDADNEGDKWTDLFHDGVGFGLDGSFLWRMSDKVYFGVYTAFQVDVFGGKSETVDVGFGPVKETLDDLVMTRFIVGARIRETFGHFFMDQNIGFGFATYSQVNADVSGTTVGVLDSTVVFAFELGFRAGFVVSPVVDLGMSLTYNYNGAPDMSSDLTSVDPGFSFKSQSNFVLGFFININFR